MRAIRYDETDRPVGVGWMIEFQSAMRAIRYDAVKMPSYEYLFVSFNPLCVQ